MRILEQCLTGIQTAAELVLAEEAVDLAMAESAQPEAAPFELRRIVLFTIAALAVVLLWNQMVKTQVCCSAAELARLRLVTSMCGAHGDKIVKKDPGVPLAVLLYQSAPRERRGRPGEGDCRGAAVAHRAVRRLLNRGQQCLESCQVALPLDVVVRGQLHGDVRVADLVEVVVR